MSDKISKRVLGLIGGALNLIFAINAFSTIISFFTCILVWIVSTIINKCLPEKFKFIYYMVLACIPIAITYTKIISIPIEYDDRMFYVLIFSFWKEIILVHPLKIILIWISKKYILNPFQKKMKLLYTNLCNFCRKNQLIKFRND